MGEVARGQFRVLYLREPVGVGYGVPMSDSALLPADDATARAEPVSISANSARSPLAATGARATAVLPARPLYAAAKRALDILVVVTFGLLVLPALLAVGAAIRLETPGPALLRQRRAGLDGRSFLVLKFRSMRLDAPPNELLTDLNVTHGPTFKAPDDPRLTRVGRFIRRTSIDEVPQFWNVLRGEMSLVGPRPLIVEEDTQLPEYARLRSAVKPGMTGAWQVAGRSLVPFDEWMALDIEYVRSRGMRRDLAILARTPWAVVSRRGAY